MNRVKAFMLLLISLLQASCTNESIEINPLEAYFQYESVNYTWGFSHNGFTIKPTGEILMFEKSTPWTFAENNLISKESFLKNLNASTNKDTLIDSSEIDLYNKLAAYAATGKLSDPVNRGADMGAAIRKIIIPDKDNPLNYREILLTQTGDIEIHNMTPQALAITDWLNKIKEELIK
jgi:hypothetical protein